MDNHQISYALTQQVPPRSAASAFNQTCGELLIKRDLAALIQSFELKSREDRNRRTDSGRWIMPLDDSRGCW